MFLPSNITLKFGDSGDFVAELQRRLVSIGAHADGGVSGTYDGATVNSVSGFQSRSGLRADGIAGPETLRRLNGVVTSSDTSGGSSSGNQEEENAKQLAANEMLRVSMAMQNPVATEPAFGVKQEEAVHAAEVHAAVEAPQYAPPPHAQPAPGALTEQQMLQQQILRESQAHQQNNSAGDILAQMLLQQTQQAQQAPRQEEQQRAAAQPHQQQPLHAAVPQAEQQAQAGAVAAAPEQAKGIVGRALQKMDGMLQKLSDYFEKKLPPDVMAEVKNIGQTMMQNGVKESAIPSGPDQARAPSTPARGPDQQPQIPTRG